MTDALSERALRIARNIIDDARVKYDAEVHIPLLITLFMEGRDIAAFCNAAEVCKKTFHNWVNTHEEFRHAYDIALVMAQTWWEEIARKGLVNPMEFNNKLFEITMRNRFGYTEHRRLNIPHLKTATNLKEQIECVMNYLSDGQLTAPEANQVSNLILSAMKVDERNELISRLDALEKSLVISGSITGCAPCSI